MLTIVKTVVFIAGNVGEIVTKSKRISSLMHFILGIYIYMPLEVAGELKLIMKPIIQ